MNAAIDNDLNGEEDEKEPESGSQEPTNED